MSAVSQILSAAEDGDLHAARELLPLVYDELKRLAEARLAKEPSAVVSSATSLVHDVFLRLKGPNDEASFANHRHFFSAAAEAMRRILIDRARKRKAAKHGGGRRRLDLDACDLGEPLAEGRDDELLALDEALFDLAKHDEKAAELVKLRFFTGLSVQQSGEMLGISRATADRYWTFARTWLFHELSKGDVAE